MTAAKHCANGTACAAVAVLGEPAELPTASVKSAKPEDIKQEMEEREKRLRASLQAAARQDAGG